MTFELLLTSWQSAVNNKSNNNSNNNNNNNIDDDNHSHNDDDDDDDKKNKKLINKISKISRILTGLYYTSAPYWQHYIRDFH